MIQHWLTLTSVGFFRGTQKEQFCWKI